jgi:transcriptional regulator with XRE-family HTH domain
LIPVVKHRKYLYSELMPKPGNPIMATALGDKIRGLRRKRGYTLEKLAELAESSKSYIWELENKNPPRPSAEKLGAIAKTLGVTLDYLIGSDSPEDLQTAEDRAFFREYQRMSPTLKAKLRQMREWLDDEA